ncbi:MAG: GldG family protein [bacterium]|nr:GldG family protein [bacterium]
MARPALTAGGQALRVLLALPALVGILLFAQALLDRRAWRLDLSPEQRYTLSEHAKRVLGDLHGDVRILAFLRSQDARNPMIRDLLRQVRAHAPGVRIDEVDVNRSPALAREHGVDSYGALVVESGGRRRVFSNPREEILIAAILQVTRQQRRTVGWVTGHGEGDLVSTDRTTGYALARAFLEQQYYEVVPVSLLADEVPVGIDVLAVIGPKKDFLPEELAAFDRFLQRPGHALLLLDPGRAPALAKLIGERYGLALPEDVVVDPGARLYGGEYVTMQVQVDRRTHAIAAGLEAPPLFSLSRSIGLPPDGTPGVVAAPIVTTGKDSWATPDTPAVRGGDMPLQPGRDRRGPLVVGAETTFLVAPDANGDARQGRLVVYGNAEFASNFFIEFLGNKDLLVNSVAWLGRDPQAIASRPSRQVPGLNQFFVSSEAGTRIFWLVAVVQPAVFALVGIVLVLRRRFGA